MLEVKLFLFKWPGNGTFCLKLHIWCLQGYTHWEHRINCPHSCKTHGADSGIKRNALKRSSESGCYRAILARDELRTLQGNIDLLGGKVAGVAHVCRSDFQSDGSLFEQSVQGLTPTTALEIDSIHGADKYVREF